jgi:hypothetical protein
MRTWMCVCAHAHAHAHAHAIYLCRVGRVWYCLSHAHSLTPPPIFVVALHFTSTFFAVLRLSLCRSLIRSSRPPKTRATAARVGSWTTYKTTSGGRRRGRRRGRRGPWLAQTKAQSRGLATGPMQRLQWQWQWRWQWTRPVSPDSTLASMRVQMQRPSHLFPCRLPHRATRSLASVISHRTAPQETDHPHTPPTHHTHIHTTHPTHHTYYTPITILPTHRPINQSYRTVVIYHVLDRPKRQGRGPKK